MTEQEVILYDSVKPLAEEANTKSKLGWRIHTMLERRDYIVVVYTRQR